MIKGLAAACKVDSNTGGGTPYGIVVAAFWMNVWLFTDKIEWFDMDHALITGR